MKVLQLCAAVAQQSGMTELHAHLRDATALRADVVHPVAILPAAARHRRTATPHRARWRAVSSRGAHPRSARAFVPA